MAHGGRGGRGRGRGRLGVPAWPRDLPEPVRDDHRIEFVSDREGHRFWPISAPVEEGVAYRFDTGH